MFFSFSGEGGAAIKGNLARREGERGGFGNGKWKAENGKPGAAGGGGGGSGQAETENGKRITESGKGKPGAAGGGGGTIFFEI